MNRRNVLGILAALAAAPLTGAQAAATQVEVWRSASCGCCGAWVKHLQQNGFATKVNLVDDTGPFRRAAGIPVALASCHTAQVAGYALEGHVPAADVKRLLAGRRDAVGLAVPGMPVGAPGMEQGGAAPPYEVLLLKRGGGTEVFARHA